jgi:hypothetical protein
MSGDYVDEYQFITLDDDRRAKLIEAVQAGATVRLACEFIGVNPLAYMVWKRGAEVYFKKTANGMMPDDFEIHAHKLYNEIEQARFAKLQEIIPYIDAAKYDDWKAAAWLAERLYPEDYGKGAGIKAETIDEEKKSPVLMIGTEPSREDMNE